MFTNIIQFVICGSCRLDDSTKYVCNTLNRRLAICMWKMLIPSRSAIFETQHSMILQHQLLLQDFTSSSGVYVYTMYDVATVLPFDESGLDSYFLYSKWPRNVSEGK